MNGVNDGWSQETESREEDGSAQVDEQLQVGESRCKCNCGKKVNVRNVLYVYVYVCYLVFREHSFSLSFFLRNMTASFILLCKQVRKGKVRPKVKKNVCP